MKKYDLKPSEFFGGFFIEQRNLVIFGLLFLINYIKILMDNKLKSFLKRATEPRYVITILVFVSLAFFGQTLSFDFLTFDDNTFITKNDVVASDEMSFADCFRYKFMEHDYFPLTFLIFRLLRVLFGFNPFVFHALNLVLHIVNVILVFLLCSRILKKFVAESTLSVWAGAIALTFAIHPMHVESVAWVMDLKDILFTLFYLAGVLTYMKWLETRNKTSYILTIVFALISLLSKSTAITFIAILFLTDWLQGEKINKKTLISKIPFFAVTLFGFYVFGLFSNPGDTVVGLTGTNSPDFIPYFPETVSGLPVLFQRAVIASFRLLFWMFHPLFPFVLNLFYTRSTLLNQYAPLLPAMPFILMSLLATTWVFRKKNPLLLFGFLFFIVTISPALAKADIGYSIFVPDRYTYLPLLGLLLMLAAILANQKKSVVLLVSLPFALFWGYKTLTYLPVWKNSFTLYDYILKLDPTNQAVLLNRSTLYLDNGEDDKALADLNTFIQKYPVEHDANAYTNRGAILKKRGEYNLALNDFNAVLNFDSTNFTALFNRGHLFLLQDRLEQSRTDFSKAYDLDSTNYNLNKYISSLYNKSGNHSVALSFAEKCLVQNNNDIDLLKVKGISLFFLGRSKEAIEALTAIIEKDKDLGEMIYFRSLARFAEKDYNGAKTDLDDAKKLGAKTDANYEKSLIDSVKLTLAYKR